ncbi:hypothetical protein BST55_03415 [Vibrio vulnificus]|uniref:hypothetical protein n=1 Tax=Vibrio vulnificus TaxID=672 RepID=UPI000BA10931|nr:hypothetical protein [Vibrio vulnificus]OZS54823.1 hypothetical protein BST51_02365 [Vibrio vulnificus]OZS59407.1 hypothetical protein BST52_00320 [Vibrio vulnificus]OZS64087.1 hypothetical protein BST56_02875 [Vibrio vulnificus]PAO28549.1 hypothetical protein BTT96_03265 [Vibrio vulnificus]PAO37570.1 hypothetical protein BTT97_04625 [Vibrio vulnificus]
MNDTQPQQPMFYAMGSGNYASAVKTASPTYQLHAIAPDAIQQVGIDYAWVLQKCRRQVLITQPLTRLLT